MSLQSTKYETKDDTARGLQKLENFRTMLKKGNFKKIYIFVDGSYLKSKTGKLFYRKTKKFGKPVIMLDNSMIEYIPELDRRSSIADDINQDLIWIQKLKRENNSLFSAT